MSIEPELSAELKAIREGLAVIVESMKGNKEYEIKRLSELVETLKKYKVYP